MVYELRAAQKTAFEDDQVMKKVHFQVDQVERQERFQCKHLSWEIRFENEQLEQHHLLETSAVKEEAKFCMEIAQRRLQHRKQVNEESQQSLANHIQAVDEIIGKAMPPIILQLTAGLLTTCGGTIPVPIPVYQQPVLVQGMKMSQNSGFELTANYRQSSQVTQALLVNS